MQQTIITNENRLQFYKAVYPVAAMNKSELINLELYSGDKVLFDSAGWYYQEQFRGQNIIKIEDTEVCENYQLNETHFDKVFSKGNITNLNFPDCTLVIDHSAYFKYQTTENIKLLLTELAKEINPNTILFRLSMLTLDDYKFTDRLKNVVSFVPDSFITNTLIYKTNTVFFDLRRKTYYDLN